MLNKRACEQCKHCKAVVSYGLCWILQCEKSTPMIIYPPQTGTDGSHNPIPEGCPYALEHIMEMQEEAVPEQNFVEYFLGV